MTGVCLLTVDDIVHNFEFLKDVGKNCRYTVLSGLNILKFQNTYNSFYLIAVLLDLNFSEEVELLGFLTKDKYKYSITILNNLDNCVTIRSIVDLDYNFRLIVARIL